MKVTQPLAALLAMSIAAVEGLQGDLLLSGGFFNTKFLTLCVPGAVKNVTVNGALQVVPDYAAGAGVFQDWADQAPAQLLPPGMWDLTPEEPEDIETETVAVRSEKELGRDAFKTVKVVQANCAADIQNICKIDPNAAAAAAGKLEKGPGGKRTLQTEEPFKSCSERVKAACPSCFPVADTEGDIDKACLCKCESTVPEVKDCFVPRRDQSNRADPAPVTASTYEARKVPSGAPTQWFGEVPADDEGRSLEEARSFRVLPGKDKGRRTGTSQGGQNFENRVPKAEAAGALKQVRDCLKQNLNQFSAQCRAALRKRKGDKEKAPGQTKAPVAAPAPAPPPANGGNTPPPVPPVNTPPPVDAPPPAAQPPAGEQGGIEDEIKPIDEAIGGFEGDNSNTELLIIVGASVGGALLIMGFAARRYRAAQRDLSFDQSRAVGNFGDLQKQPDSDFGAEAPTSYVFPPREDGVRDSKASFNPSHGSVRESGASFQSQGEGSVRESGLSSSFRSMRESLFGKSVRESGASYQSEGEGSVRESGASYRSGASGAQSYRSGPSMRETQGSYQSGPSMRETSTGQSFRSGPSMRETQGSYQSGPSMRETQGSYQSGPSMRETQGSYQSGPSIRETQGSGASGMRESSYTYDGDVRNTWTRTTVNRDSRFS